ncbi:hypothetical protein ES703_112050 [subsurface metagenome]
MKSKMNLKWGEERFKGFSDPIRTVEEINGWTWWVLFAAGIATGIMIVLKISGKI